MGLKLQQEVKAQVLNLQFNFVLGPFYVRQELLSWSAVGVFNFCRLHDLRMSLTELSC